MMRQENYQLLMSSSLNGQQQLGKLISYIFSNQYLYVHAVFRKLVEQDRKGYIALHELLKNESIQKYFEEVELTNRKYELIFLKETIKFYCHELHVHEERVRRINPWRRNVLKNIKPISLQQIQENLTVSDVRQYFGEDCFTPNQKIQPNKQGLIRIYLQKNSNKVAQIVNSNLPFRILKYPQLCKQRVRTAKFWQLRQLRSYRPLQYLKTQKKLSHDTNYIRSYRAERQQYCPDSNEPSDNNQARSDKNTFIRLIKASNPQFNSLLFNHMDQCRQNLTNSP